MNNRFTVKDIRTKNKINVLTTIIAHNGITRNELAKITNVSLMTITNVVDELLDAEYIYETKTESSIGRTPSNLYVNNKDGVFLCVDLTSTHTCDYIMYNVKKKIIFSDTYKYDVSDSYINNINNILKVIKKAVDKFEVKIYGIGLAVPGAYIVDNDTVRTSLIEEHQNINFYKIFNQFFLCDNIIIGHDVNMAAKAEMEAVSPASSLFYIYIGEGVGGTYVNNGEVVKGLDLLAGDIGQIIVEHNNRETALEDILSIPSIERYMKDNINDIIRKYLEDDMKIVEHMQSIFKIISTQIYNLSWLFNPNYIVISSSSKQLSRLITDYASKMINSKKVKATNSKSSFLINTKVISSNYSENPALIGLLGEIINNHIEVCAQ